jgi:hypothetical protein
MQHHFTSGDRTSGAWWTPGTPERLYCRWFWEPASHQLVVHCGAATETITLDTTHSRLLECVVTFCPDIALRAAELLDRTRS